MFVSTYAAKSSLRAYLSHASFCSPENGPFVETYLSILGKSVQFVKSSEGKFQGTIQVTMLFKQHDSIKEFRKYALHTAEIADTSNINFVVFDQQRIALPSGKYKIELLLSDMNRDLPAFKAKDSLALDFAPKKIGISDIELVESAQAASESSKIAKSGYDFIPYQDNFFPEGMKKISFYAEIYNTESIFPSGSPFLVTTSIQSVETGKTIGDFQRIKRETAGQVNVVYNDFDISELPSGNFNLVISVRDKENKEVAMQRLFFQRSNPSVQYNTQALQNVIIGNSFVSMITSVDTLHEYIRMCGPIAGANEKLFINSLPKHPDLLTMQQFFLEFWTQRNKTAPMNEWIKYYNTVQVVNKEFGSIYKKGYETDRGRVYLEYGAPNQRIQETVNPDTFPYEIWQYYSVKDQSNVKFVFYTRDRALNDYLLAHSTAIGEVKNVTWQAELNRRPGNPDPNKDLYNKADDDDVFGEHTGDYYNLKKQ